MNGWESTYTLVNKTSRRQFMKNKIIASCIVCAMFITPVCFATDSVYVWSTSSNTINEVASSSNGIDNQVAAGTNTTVSNNGDDAVPTSAEAKEDNSLRLESGAAILMDQSTGNVLYAHNIHEKLRPASVTKVMSLLLIMEALDNGQISLTDQVPCSENAHAMGGSQIWLDTTENLSVNDMLKSMCVVSANDCTVAMAEYLAGSEESFVQRMNQRAKELGMNDTTFKNCHGIDEDGHVTSAYDIAVMSRELLLNHPSITQYTTIWMDSIRDGKSELVNTNKLVRNYKGATGLKTGSTSLALYNLSASATRDDLSLIAVIMKAPTTKIRFAEATKLLDYGFANYHAKSFGKRGEVLSTEAVNKGVTKEVDLVLEKDASVLLKKGQDSNIEQNITINTPITAPVHEGDCLGKITYTLDGQTLLEVNLLAASNIPKSTLWNLTTSLYTQWFNMFR